MNLKDNVTIIIPNHNTERFIIQTLHSVNSQTYKDFHCIIIDDFSSDKSVDKIKKFIKNKKKFELIDLKYNVGVAEARNIGIRKSQSRFIAFLDSDDIWAETKLEKQVELLNNTDAVFSYTATEYINESGDKIKSIRKVPKNIYYKDLLTCNYVTTSSVLFDRKKRNDLLMPNIIAEDYACWLKSLKNSGFAAGINEILVSYRKRKNSISSNRFKSIKKVWTVQTVQENQKKFKVVINIIIYLIKTFIKHYI